MAKITLEKLTGLSEDDLAHVFSKNPRAYMAVKGAVAEKHLENLLCHYKSIGKIKDFVGASGDFDKDFYVTLKSGDTISLECKNIQVLNTSTKNIFSKYLKFLVNRTYLDEDWLLQIFNSMVQSKPEFENKPTVDSLHDILEFFATEKLKYISEMLKHIPQELRESGVPRYEFSASMLKESDISKLDIDEFVSQFEKHPLTIDFQRTRNSTDDDGDTKKQRFYRKGEIDVVGACLFSRSMRWQFIFGHSRHYESHKKYADRYSNKFIIRTGKWSPDLISSLSIH